MMFVSFLRGRMKVIQVNLSRRALLKHPTYLEAYVDLIASLYAGLILLMRFINTLATLVGRLVTRDSQLFYFLTLARNSGQIGLLSQICIPP